MTRCSIILCKIRKIESYLITFLKGYLFQHTMDEILLPGEKSQEQKQRELFIILIEAVLKNKPNKDKLIALKNDICKQQGIKKVPKDLEILMQADEVQREQLKPYLLTKPIRSMSGVSPIAVMTEPRHCPHGKCTYCPGGIGSPFGDVPQSYTGKEPASMRAIRNNYDAYLQVFNRLEYYVIGGHTPDKAELIIMGGTFPSYEWEYQEGFVSKCLQAMNDFGNLFYPEGKLDIEAFKNFFELPGEPTDQDRAARLKKKMADLYEKNKKDLETTQKENQDAMIRCTGMTMETRPDFRIFEQAEGMLKLGCTRVELGVQSVYPQVLKAVHRDHNAQDSKNAIQLLKDLGFKINAHMMPGLPETTPEMEKKNLTTLFEDPEYRPDMLKIYPCMVLKGTPLYDDWKAGKFKPIQTKAAVELIADFLPKVPRYVRVMRVQRDIPTYRTEAGVDKTNLRQYINERLDKANQQSQDIRAREVMNQDFDEPTMNVEEYEASKGTEFFISLDTPDDRLVGFARMRFASQQERPEITPTSALLRELHVNGSAVQIGESGEVQHRGFGKQLLAKAEEIAKQKGKDKMVVISGIGVRNYYAKRGYHLEGPYMVKMLE